MVNAKKNPGLCDGVHDGGFEPSGDEWKRGCSIYRKRKWVLWGGGEEGCVGGVLIFHEAFEGVKEVEGVEGGVTKEGASFFHAGVLG
jgi:hypothetical protein